MICEDCHGEGGWAEARGVRYFRQHPKPAYATWRGCPSCGGCGFSHCCEGERPDLAPPEQALTLPAPYPLAWPPDRPRIPSRERQPDRYEAKTVTAAMASAEMEVKRWRAPTRSARIINWELSSDYLGRAQPPDDPGAALWFTLGGKDITGGASLMVLACDRFHRLPQNIRALSLTMERLRLVDEVGAYSLIAAVEGARALPPPGAAVAVPDRPWREVLGIAGEAPLLIAEAAYRALARKAGEGSPKLTELNLAIEAARRELR